MLFFSDRSSRSLVSTVAIAGIALPLAGCQWMGTGWMQSQAVPQSSAPSVQVSLPPLSQAKKIQVYMNHSEAAQYRDLDRAIDRKGDNLEQVILTAIQGAQTEIQIAVQEFRLPRLAQALADRAKAGVKIHVILENKYSTPYSSYNEQALAKLSDRERKRYEDYKSLMDRDRDGQFSETEIQTQDALAILDRAGIRRTDDKAGPNGLMHHKFMVIDGQQTIVTSANWTRSDIHGDFNNPESRGNANNLLQIASPAVAQIFQAEFKQLAAQKFKRKKQPRSPQTVTIGDANLMIQFSPSAKQANWNSTTNGLIAATVTRAKRSLDIATFVFSDGQLSAALSPLSQRSIPLRVLIAPDFFYRPYSVSLDMLGIAVPCRKMLKNQPPQTPRPQTPRPQTPWSPAIATVGSPKLQSGDLLHHKFAIVDQHTVITGSHNWTQAGNYTNDETLLILQSPTVAAHYQREFDRLYENADLGFNPKRPICQERSEAE